MSYEEFRRRIDTARQILVGAVPSPAGQIDQITYALMYKFMNDIDDESAALGGKRSYFVGEYAKFNWHELMSTQLGAHERLELYREAIQTMAKNENLPELFRSIYQNAFLPFNSANVLTLFLKEIDKFSHGESDDIGDAYEYLLSITGAQGDVGQFRTPRHIIKFIVEAVNPTKDDKVLDPAVGTAGFLIAAYNYVKSQHDGKNESGERNDEKRLTADELHKIHHNYRGFDIDPTMVRTAKINMYLHGFKTPDIINHDSLSSEEYWNDWYDVILANPPFMTPKGGIQPHKKFGISANRAEVLFVDYIASHLKPNGRAGIVVPEGIIFQSGKAYKELRKNLVENYLYAVVSLPAGVFQPYSGVKTSVLLFDKELAKRRDEILFVKVENDGYSLGAQRRAVAGDQFPEALDIIEKFKAGEEFASEFTHTVLRSEIAASGDYNLSGDRYKRIEVLSTEFDHVAIRELVQVISGVWGEDPGVSDINVNAIKVANVKVGGHIDYKNSSPRSITQKQLENNKLENGDIVVVKSSGSANSVVSGKCALVKNVPNNTIPVNFLLTLRPDKFKILPELLYHFLASPNARQHVLNIVAGSTYPNLKTKEYLEFQIPLPPIEIQREIVAELDGYQKIIDAAQTIVQTYKPTIKINPEWKMARLDDLAIKITDGSHSSPPSAEKGKPYVTVKDVRDGRIDLENSLKISAKDYDKLVKNGCQPELGDVLFSKDGTVGRVALVKTKDEFVVLSSLAIIRPNNQIIDSAYLAYALEDPAITAVALGMMKGIAIRRVILRDLKELKIPLPPIEIQREIVAELEAEQQPISANKKLIEIYQQKIKSKIAEVWGE